MRVIAIKTLKVFWQKHKNCEQQLKAWYDEAQQANWQRPNDIKVDYPTASFLQDNRVVFNIKGNDYRLVVHIDYLRKIVRVKFIGTHSEYDKINIKDL